MMHELFHASRRRFLAVASEFELSPPQVRALNVLEPGRPVPMSELADALHCDNSNVTGIVDRLEDRGLVERRSATHDRRVKMLVVTERGAEVPPDLFTSMFTCARVAGWSAHIVEQTREGRLIRPPARPHTAPSRWTDSSIHGRRDAERIAPCRRQDCSSARRMMSRRAR